MIKKKVERILELRATVDNLKSLEEQRAELEEKMESLVSKAEEETRAFTEDETKDFGNWEAEKARLDKTIKAIENKRAADKKTEVKPGSSETDEVEKVEERAFANYIRGVVTEERAENLTLTDNGAVVPTSIAQKIIKKVLEISPIYKLATRYNVTGNLSIPYYDESSQKIQVAYATEFTDLESSNAKFNSIELKGFLAGALSKISNSLINNSQFDIVSFVINAMAESVANWIDKELLNGTSEKIEGLSGIKKVITAASATAITADELIDVQEEVPDAFQANAIWIMSRNTRKAIRKLKDNDGQYLMNKDATSKWGYVLFGKDVYVSENMPDMSSGKSCIYYGDMSGLAVKLSEDVNIQILREKYATQHATGVIAWIEADSKVEDAQKIAKLKMGS